MSEELEPGFEDYEDDNWWEYEEMAIRDEQERKARERWERLPAICKRCHWYDDYMYDGCVHSRWPKNIKADYKPSNIIRRIANILWPRDGKCNLYLWRWFFSRPRWLYLFLASIEQWAWDFRTRNDHGKFSAHIGGYYPEEDEDYYDEDLEHLYGL